MHRRLRGPARAAGAALVAAVLLAGCGSDTGDGAAGSPRPSRSGNRTASTTPSSPASSPATPTAGPAAPSASSSATAGSPAPATPLVSNVYYLEDTRDGVRLVREQRDLPGAAPVEEAVQAMVAGPHDPDYRSPWNPRTKVVAVTRRAGAIDVDLSAAARSATVGSEAAQRMVQQLVYTVTEAARRPAAKVRLTIGGRPAGDLWGVTSWTGPVGRADPAVVRVLVQIDTPRDGVTAGSPVTVSGEADAFEANVPWQVLDGHGSVVRQGAATAREGMTFSPYRFTVRLAPGRYTVRVSEDDVSGGEGGAPMSDTKRITVE